MRREAAAGRDGSLVRGCAVNIGAGGGVRDEPGAVARGASLSAAQCSAVLQAQKRAEDVRLRMAVT